MEFTVTAPTVTSRTRLSSPTTTTRRMESRRPRSTASWIPVASAATASATAGPAPRAPGTLHGTRGTTHAPRDVGVGRVDGDRGCADVRLDRGAHRLDGPPRVPAETGCRDGVELLEERGGMRVEVTGSLPDLGRGPVRHQRGQHVAADGVVHHVGQQRRTGGGVGLHQLVGAVAGLALLHKPGDPSEDHDGDDLDGNQDQHLGADGPVGEPTDRGVALAHVTGFLGDGGRQSRGLAHRRRPASLRGKPGHRMSPLEVVVITGRAVSSGCGGAKGTRTPNPLLAKQVRYQLRHGPWVAARRRAAGRSAVSVA